MFDSLFMVEMLVEVYLDVGLWFVDIGVWVLVCNFVVEMYVLFMLFCDECINIVNFVW